MDPMVRVDRSTTPNYPRGMIGGLLYPEFEFTGPEEFDVLLFRWQDLLCQCVEATGEEAHEYLKKNRLLSSRLTLSDLLAIRVRGIVFYRQYFSGMKIAAWKSIGKFKTSGYGMLPCVPYLYEGDKDRVDLGWRFLVHKFTREYYAPGFEKDYQ